MKKSTGCPADGIEGFRLFMIGQREKPMDPNLLPPDVMRQLSVIHKKYGSGSPSKLLTGTDVLNQRKGITGLLSKNASSKVSMPSAAAANTSQSKSKDGDSDESLGDINEKKFLSTLESANEKIQVYKHLFYNKKPNFEKENIF